MYVRYPCATPLKEAPATSHPAPRIDSHGLQLRTGQPHPREHFEAGLLEERCSPRDTLSPAPALKKDGQASGERTRPISLALSLSLVLSLSPSLTVFRTLSLFLSLSLSLSPSYSFSRSLTLSLSLSLADSLSPPLGEKPGPGSSLGGRAESDGDALGFHRRDAVLHIIRAHLICIRLIWFMS